MAAFRTESMRRIFWLSAALVSVATIAVLTPIALHAAKERRAIAASQVKPIPASAAEQSEIIRAVLKSQAGLLLPPGSHGKPFVMNHTVVICDSASGNGEATRQCGPPGTYSIYDTDLDAAIPRSLRLELVAANDRPTRLVDGHWAQGDLSPYSSVSEALKDTGSWERFYTHFPASVGLLEFSRAVISKDGTRALVYVGHYAGGLAGRGSLLYLTRHDDTWVISVVVGLWVS